MRSVVGVLINWPACRCLIIGHPVKCENGSSTAPSAKTSVDSVLKSCVLVREVFWCAAKLYTVPNNADPVENFAAVAEICKILPNCKTDQARVQ